MCWTRTHFVPWNWNDNEWRWKLSMYAKTTKTPFIVVVVESSFSLLCEIKNENEHFSGLLWMCKEDRIWYCEIFRVPMEKAHQVEPLKKRPDLPHGNRDTKLHLGNIIYAIYFLIQFYYISSSSAAAVPSLSCSHAHSIIFMALYVLTELSREKTFQIFSPRARFVSLLSRENICTRIKFDDVDVVSSTCIGAFFFRRLEKITERIRQSGNQ